MKRPAIVLTLAALVLLSGSRAQAHFLWLVTAPPERPTEVRLYFGEEPAPDDPELLDNVARTQGWLAGSRRAEPAPLEWKKDKDAWLAKLPEGTSSPVMANLSYGVISRGGDTFLLKYYAKAYPSQLPGTWQAVSDAARLALEIVPVIEGATASFEVRYKGEPLPGAAVTVIGPGYNEPVEGTTDAKGRFQAKLADEGVYSIRARHVENTAGEHDGKAYTSVRHYSTLAMPYTKVEIQTAAHNWPPLPRSVTSFGAAVVGDWLYVYGGHYGQAHHYSREGQSGDFLRLNLRSGSSWETLPGGPKLTGLGMAAYEGKLYRVGGFTAKNGEGEDERLHSQADFAVFDPDSGKWTSLPPLPEGRSSLDAAVVGNRLYVAGGWNMQGDAETVWHDTAWSIDLSQDSLRWTQIARPPFKRRAVALAAHEGKLYVLGGMQEQGGPTTRVAVYDPQSDKWSEGPALLGTPMDGFGCAAFACKGRLYATTMSGAVQQLSEDGTKWEYAGRLENPRFFHRMLPWQGKELVIVGGAHMAVGKIDVLERLPLSQPNAGQ